MEKNEKLLFLKQKVNEKILKLLEKKLSEIYTKCCDSTTEDKFSKEIFNEGIILIKIKCKYCKKIKFFTIRKDYENAQR